MGNLFIGFPVPRAKIAEMIEGSAPPLQHKENHEPDGSDPLALPGDISAGQLFKWNGSKFIGVDEPSAGISIPFDDIYLNELIQSKNCLYQYTGTSGVISETGAGVTLASGTDLNSYAEIQKFLTPYRPYCTWAKKRTVTLNIDFSSSDGANDEFWLVSGRYGNNNHIGFKVISQVVYGTCYQSAESTVPLIGHNMPPFFYTSYTLKFIFDGSASVKFYVDDVEYGEITTNIPTGTMHANRIFNLYSKTLTEGWHADIMFHNYSFYQGA